MMLREYELGDVMNATQLHHVVNNILRERNISGASWCVAAVAMKPANEGLAGFLGDHIKMQLTLKCNDDQFTAHLFVKSMPLHNAPKAHFIDDNNFFRREMIMYQLFEEFDDASEWRPKVYLCDERIVVMPDLTYAGYVTIDKMHPLDMQHVTRALHTIAHYHAAYTNCSAARRRRGIAHFHEVHQRILAEPSYVDCSWLRAGATLVVNFLDEYSSIKGTDAGALVECFVMLCERARVYDDTLNVIIHKDLWSNNLMFKYANGAPDYQCVRCAPPAFDVMVFMYLTTDRTLRRACESTMLRVYYEEFQRNLDERAKEETALMGYGFDAFTGMCERARGFGLLVAAMIFPYILMDGRAAVSTFDDPNTFERMLEVDRSAPVIAHAALNTRYKDRMLEIFEEIVQYSH